MLFAAWAIALLTGLLLSYAMRGLSHRIGLVDRPDPSRKLHRGDIALGGGLAVLATCGLTLLVFHLAIAPAAALGGLPWSSRWTSLAVASLLITALGVIDDRRSLSGMTKLLGQVAVAALVAFFWQPTGYISFFGLTVDIGALSGMLLMFWLLVSINAVNLLDGADGVTGSFGAVAAIGIAVVAVLNENLTAAVVAIVLSAALVGFLAFNRPPATMFLGDAGSMLVGLALGALACLAVADPGSPQEILIPITLLGLPLVDSTAAGLRRVLTGRSIFTPDRGHLHHRVAAQLAARGFSPAWMMVIFAGLAACTSAGAVLGTMLSSGAVAIGSVALLVIFLVATRIFGRAESDLLYLQTRRLAGRLLMPPPRGEPKVHVSGVTLQGQRQWEGVWQPLVDFAEKNGLWRLRLDLNMPWRHEGYHGSWMRGALPDAAEQWSVRLPVVCSERIVGRLDMVGRTEGLSQIESLESFSYLIAELQPEMEKLACSLDDVSIAERQPAARAGVPIEDRKELAAARR